VTDGVLQPILAEATKSNDKQTWTYLGIAYAKFGKLAEAEAAFGRVLKMDPNSIGAQVNLGNIAYLQRDYRKALVQYQGAYTVLTKQGKPNSMTAQKVLVSMSKSYTGLKDFAQARATFERATAIDSDQVREFAYLAQVGASSDIARGDNQADIPLFMTEE
jgi:tetratricopeptide (TPR) repeat protein